MDSKYFEFGWLGYFIFGTYVVQLIQIGFFPIPSAGSTYEMLFRRVAFNEQSKKHLLNLVAISTAEKSILMGITVAVIILSLVPAATLFWPSVYRYLWPFFENPPKLLGYVSALLLVAGNVITGMAVLTLKKHVSFHHFGETKKLYTRGIFGFVRNPITIGLAFIYGGFFLALPSGAMALGFVVFLLNSNRRIRMEEHYLERSFGNLYLKYKERVGKYRPKLRRCQRVKHDKALKIEIK